MQPYKARRNLRAQLTSAKTELQQTRRAANAAWASVVVNGLVVIAALGTLFVQREWVQQDRATERHLQDWRAISAGADRLDQLDALIANGLPDSLCARPTGEGTYFNRTMPGAISRMKDAERTAFAQGVNDDIQLREEADMRETRSALELAFDNISFLIASPYAEAARRQQVCFYAKRAVRGAARSLQMTVLRDLEGFDDDSFAVQKNEALKLVRSLRF